MEVQEEEDAVEQSDTTNPAKTSTALTYLSGNRRNISPNERQNNDTSKKVSVESDVNNVLLLTETVNNKGDAHMSDARTGNYIEGGFPEMQ